MDKRDYSKMSAVEIAGELALDVLFNKYYEYHRITREQIMEGAIAGCPKVMADLGLLIGSLDRDTLAAIIAK